MHFGAFFCSPLFCVFLPAFLALEYLVVFIYVLFTSSFFLIVKFILLFILVLS
jgi:hypothetical protein